MLFSTSGQAQLFVWMAGAGVVIGAMHAFFEALRIQFGSGAIASLLSEFGFGLCAAAIFLFALVTGNYGRIRLFEIIAVLLGWALFHFGVEPELRRLALPLKRLFVKIKAVLSKNHLIKVIFK